MSIYHIVLFKFKDDLPKEVVEKVSQPLYLRHAKSREANQRHVAKASEGMVTLESKLLHPVTKKTYVRNRIGGINNSPEGRAVSSPSINRSS